ncbi:hypothetical protein PbJCM13498_03120 [Prolixibacter bellariivorans]|uniref:Uncharacterized protein n=1 Tax=Prolixibacter bellariivorans TaxID=314319 RepID=A0A5M4AU24_9BACT|nr:hypothetical protein PbJCM13498_03120 [Prolixibacter bellariivorans]
MSIREELMPIPLALISIAFGLKLFPEKLLSIPDKLSSIPVQLLVIRGQLFPTPDELLMTRDEMERIRFRVFFTQFDIWTVRIFLFVSPGGIE